MKLKVGYKQTEIGAIPDDWIAKSFGDICWVNQGLQIAIEDRLKNPTERSRIYITIQYLNDRKETEFIDEFTDSVCCGNEDILMTRTGNTGIVVTNVEGVFHNNFFKINFDKKHIDRKYLLYFLFQDIIQIIILKKAGTSTIPDLNHDDFYSIPIVFPPTIEEQRTIAAALSDVDALIAALDRLIAKKRDIKLAAMQELLTGKRRLPGFEGEWRTRRLGEVIANCSSGATPYRGYPDYYNGSVKWITSGELNYNLISDTIEHISDEAVRETNLKVHPVGTFLMAITGLEAAGTRGACGIVGSPATTNQSCMAIYPTSELKMEYLYHYYVLRGNALAFQYCQGTKQQSYTAKLVRLLPIDLPPTVEEQAAIAAILSDMDIEIAALEARREKTLALKQGMMQELLTGRIRLVQGAEA
jgi:type I restriction enzyme, S subunit